MDLLRTSTDTEWQCTISSCTDLLRTNEKNGCLKTCASPRPPRKPGSRFVTTCCCAVVRYNVLLCVSFRTTNTASHRYILMLNVAATHSKCGEDLPYQVIRVIRFPTYCAGWYYYFLEEKYFLGWFRIHVRLGILVDRVPGGKVKTQKIRQRHRVPHKNELRMEIYVQIGKKTNCNMQFVLKRDQIVWDNVQFISTLEDKTSICLQRVFEKKTKRKF